MYGDVGKSLVRLDFESLMMYCLASEKASNLINVSFKWHSLKLISHRLCVLFHPCEDYRMSVRTSGRIRGSLPFPSVFR